MSKLAIQPVFQLICSWPNTLGLVPLTACHQSTSCDNLLNTWGWVNTELCGEFAQRSNA